MLFDDYLKRNLKDFFKSKRADFDNNCNEQGLVVRKDEQ